MTTDAQQVYAENAFLVLRDSSYPIESSPGVSGLALTLVMSARMSGAKTRADVMALISDAWKLSEEITE